MAREIEPEAEPETADQSPRGRAGGRDRTKTQSQPRPAKKPKGHTIYLADDLFERIIVQAHRRGKTISEYVAAILERQVPDHRTIRPGESDEGQGGSA